MTRKLIVALLVSAFILTPASAQEEGTIERRIAAMNEWLDLTDEQVTQLRAIFARSVDTERGDLRSAIGEVLTPEQRAKLAKRQLSMALRMRDGDRREAYHTMPLRRTAWRLDLTDEQQAMLKEAYQSHRDATGELRESISEILTPGQKESLRRHRARMDARRYRPARYHWRGQRGMGHERRPNPAGEDMSELVEAAMAYVKAAADSIEAGAGISSAQSERMQALHRVLSAALEKISTAEQPEKIRRRGRNGQ